MDWVGVLRELRLGLLQLRGIKAAAFGLIAVILVVLVIGRGILLLSFLLHS